MKEYVLYREAVEESFITVTCDEVGNIEVCECTQKIYARVL